MTILILIILSSSEQKRSTLGKPARIKLLSSFGTTDVRLSHAKPQIFLQKSFAFILNTLENFISNFSHNYARTTNTHMPEMSSPESGPISPIATTAVPPFRPITPDPRRPPVQRLSSILANASNGQLTTTTSAAADSDTDLNSLSMSPLAMAAGSLPPHMTDLNTFRKNKSLGAIPAHVPLRDSPHSAANVSLDDLDFGDRLVAPSPPLSEAGNGGFSEPGSLQASPHARPRNRGSKLRRSSEMTFSQLIAESQERSASNSLAGMPGAGGMSRGSAGTGSPASYSSGASDHPNLRSPLSPLPSTAALHKKSPRSSVVLGAGPSPGADTLYPHSPSHSPSSRHRSFPGLRLASLEQIRSPVHRDLTPDLTQVDERERDGGSDEGSEGARPKAARTRTRSELEPLALVCACVWACVFA